MFRTILHLAVAFDVILSFPLPVSVPASTVTFNYTQCLTMPVNFIRRSTMIKWCVSLSLFASLYISTLQLLISLHYFSSTSATTISFAELLLLLFLLCYFAVVWFFSCFSLVVVLLFHCYVTYRFDRKKYSLFCVSWFSALIRFACLLSWFLFTHPHGFEWDTFYFVYHL